METALIKVSYMVRKLEPAGMSAGKLNSNSARNMRNDRERTDDHETSGLAGSTSSSGIRENLFFR